MQKAIIILLGLLALASAQTVVTEGTEATPLPGSSTPVEAEPTAAPSGSTPEGSGTTPVPSGSTPEGSDTTPNSSGSTPEGSGTTPNSSGSTPEGSGTTPVPGDSTPVTNAPGGSTPAESVPTVAPGDTTQPPLQTTTDPGDCVYESQTWGVPNLQEFGFCLDGAPRITECNENQYYVSNATVSGCVPANEMNVNCRNLDVVVNQCTGIYTKQPQLSETITDYYFCDGESLDPIELSCLSGAFIKQDLYMGCFDWPEWRQLRNCEVDQYTTLKM